MQSTNHVTSLEKQLPVIGLPHVYFLATFDNSEVKIGYSIDPLDRIAGLDNIYPNIDLARSVILHVDSRRIETILHLVFGLRRQPLENRCDGYTEWFAGDFLDEAVAFAQQVAHHRGVEYPVFRNVDRLLRAYRAQNPHAGERSPRLTRAERETRAANAPKLLRNAILDYTQDFVDTLYEGDFVALVRHDGQAYLSRTVYREQEPECWQRDGAHTCSAWGRQLSQKAHVRLQVDGGSCTFNLLTLTTFMAIDDTHGHEYFRISQERPRSSGLGEEYPFLTNGAFAELWNAIEHLPVIDAAGNFSNSVQRTNR